MALTKQVLEDGERNFSIHIVGTADAAGTTIDISAEVAANTRFGAPSALRLDKVLYSTDQDVTLSWDATANVAFLVLATGEEDFDFRKFGGINNNAGAGVTGDVIIAPAAAADYMITLWFTKQFD
jgi:hypothetical protein